MLRTVLSQSNYGDIRLQYIRAGFAPPEDVEHEISITPTAQLEVEPSCASFTVKSACVFCS